VIAKDFGRALEASDLAISLSPDTIWMQTNRAHALMFPNEPREIYLKFRGKKSHGNKIWEDDVKDDFAELRKHGLSHPLMDQIERTFNGSSAVNDRIHSKIR